MRVPLAGLDITDFLASKLLPKIGVEFNTSAERDQAYDIKKAICYVKEGNEKSSLKGSMSYTLPSG